MIVRIESDSGQRVLIKALGRMNDALDAAFLQSIRGALWDRSYRCYAASWESLTVILARLRANHFQLELGSDVATAAQQTILGTEKSITQAKERVIRFADRLYPYQRSGAVKLASRRRFLLADEMGLGKTRQAIFAIPDGSATLIVCPALPKKKWMREFQTLRLRSNSVDERINTWAAEVAECRPEFEVTVLFGKGSFRWPKPGEVVITNFDILPKPPLGRCMYTPRGGAQCKSKRRFGHPTCGVHRKEYPYVDPDFCIYCGKKQHAKEGLSCLDVEIGMAPGGLVCVVDECHAFKGKKSLRTVSWRFVKQTALARGGFAWGLTGSPVMNDPDELWEVLDAFDLAGEAFGQRDDFVKVFGGTKNFFGGVQWPDYRHSPIPKEAIENLGSVMLRRIKDEVLPELPEKRYEEVEVDLSLSLKRECDDAVRDAAIDVMDDRFLEKVPFIEISRVRKNLATAKIPAMEDFVTDCEKNETPLIVFSAHRAPIEELRERKGWAVITGDEQSFERQRLADLFQAGKLKGIAGTTKAMGVAIDLTYAQTMLFVDCEWVPALQWQAEDRAHRIGQLAMLRIVRLVGDHVLERRVAEVLARKTALHNMTIGAVETTPEVTIDVLDLEGMKIDPRQMNILQPTTFNPANPGSLSKVKRRFAQTVIEQWAERGIQFLAASDKDRARSRNNIGFMRAHTDLGHQFASQIEAKMGLSEVQWRAVVSMARSYTRQIGFPPEVSESEES